MLSDSKTRRGHWAQPSSYWFLDLLWDSCHKEFNYYYFVWKFTSNIILLSWSYQLHCFKTEIVVLFFIYAKVAPYLKKSINKTHFGTFEQIVTQLERELNLNSFEAPDEQQVNTVSQYATKSNSQKPKLSCHYCKKSEHYKDFWPLLKKQEGISADTNKSSGKRQ